MIKVMVFGVFDGLHEGHRAFLKYAKKEGDYLIVVVTQDQIVARLKGHLPQRNLAERFDHLKKEDGVDEVVIGDAAIGVWDVVRQHKPDIIALGYDQNAMHEELTRNLNKLGCEPEIRVMPAYEPNKYHSSHA